MTSRVPWVTLLVAGGILYVAWEVTGFVPDRESIEGVAWSRQAWAQGQWDKLVLSMFAHGGVVHLAVNMIALASFGPVVERGLGPARFAAVYLASGMAGNLAHAAYAADVPVVGASAALFGLFGLMMMLTPGQWVSILGLVPAPILLAGAAYTATVPLLLRFQASVPIAHEAHLGGMLAGMAFAAAVHPRKALYVLPAAAGVFWIAWLAVSFLVGVDWQALLRAQAWQAWLAALWPLLAAAAVLAGIFAYLRWVEARLGRGGKAEPEPDAA